MINYHKIIYNGSIDLLELIKQYFYCTKKNILIFVVASFSLFAGLYMYYKYYKVDTYTSKVSFFIEESDPSIGISSLFGGMGIPTSSTMDKKIISVATSFNVISSALLDSVIINSQKNILVNHIIKTDEKLQNDITTKWPNFKAFTSIVFDNYSSEEIEIIRHVVCYINQYYCTGVQGGRLLLKYNEDDSLYELSYVSNNQELSVKMTETIYNKIKYYLLDESIGQKQKTHDQISNKVDSLRRVMNGIEYELASINDGKKALIFDKSQLRKNELYRMKSVTQILYGEAVKNQEMSDMSVKTSVPNINILDRTYLPIYTNNVFNISKTAILSILFSFLLSIMLFVFKLFKTI